MNLNVWVLHQLAVTWALSGISPLGVAQTAIAKFPGNAADDEYGFSIAVGDLDGDGIDEIIIGAPGSDTAFADGGEVTVVSLAGGTLATMTGSAANEAFGTSVGVLGAVDVDATLDVLVGVPGRGFRGAVAAHSGANGTEIYEVLHAGAGTMGHVIATGGHVDADGVGDFVAVNYASPWGSGTTGNASVHTGADGGMIRMHSGSFIHGHAFRSVTFFDDVDGNGLDEYALGGIAGSECYSEIDAYRGSNGALIWADDGDIFTEYGFAVAAPGDLNGIGGPDIVGIGRGYPTSCFGTSMESRIVSATTGALIQSSPGTWGGEFLGSTTAALGDVDADGTPEYAIGTEGLKIQVFSGLSSTESLLINAPSFNGFSRGLAAGDVNGDGLTDLAVGAPTEGPTGEVTIFTIVLAPTTYCQAQTNSQGCVPQISYTGVPSLTIITFRIRATNVLNNKAGLLFWGLVPENLPFLGGTLCVRPPLARTTVQFSAGNPPPDDCSGSYSFHFSGVYMTSVGLQAGDRVYAQYWARDPADPSGTNLTDALAFPIEP